MDLVDVCFTQETVSLCAWHRTSGISSSVIYLQHSGVRITFSCTLS
jgi:hypothetical protein